MNKQEILEEIKKTEEHLTNMKKMLEECEYERWKPQEDERYYYVNSWSEIESDNFNKVGYCDSRRYKFFNCFQTYKQAEAEAEKILVRRQLEDTARRLNKGQKIDWNNQQQRKYSLYLSSNRDAIEWYGETYRKVQGTVYCLDNDFYNVAIREIGEERLKRYLRGE